MCPWLFSIVVAAGSEHIGFIAAGGVLHVICVGACNVVHLFVHYHRYLCSLDVLYQSLYLIFVLTCTSLQSGSACRMLCSPFLSRGIHRCVGIVLRNFGIGCWAWLSRRVGWWLLAPSDALHSLTQHSLQCLLLAARNVPALSRTLTGHLGWFLSP